MILMIMDGAKRERKRWMCHGEAAAAALESGIDGCCMGSHAHTHAPMQWPTGLCIIFSSVSDGGKDGVA